MMKNQHRIGERERQRREIMKPTLNPRTLHFWLKDYEIESNAKYGDVSIYVFTNVNPAYMEDDFNTYIMDKRGMSDVAELNGINGEIWKLEQKSWFFKRNTYDENFKAMFNDMILHFSDESTNLIHGFVEDFKKCSTDQNPQALLKLVKKSHTQAGRVVSREEKEEKKDRLKRHRQWDRNGKIHGIHDHNRLFKALLEDTIEIGLIWDDSDIVDLYLKSIDNTLIVGDLARIKVEGCTEMPKNLEAAQFWVIEANRRNKDIKDNAPNRQKRKADDPPERVLTADSTGSTPLTDYPECIFCKKKHLGGAQECAYLKRHLEDHPDEISATLAKKVTYPSSKRNRSSGRGSGKGKGGRGGGRSGGKGRGGGRSGGKGRGGRGGSGSSTAMHAKDVTADTDDTWADFNRDQALSSIYHYEVTVFKTGKVSMQQKQDKLIYLYDNGATLNLFCNEDVLWDVEDVQPIPINGIGNVWVTRRGMSLFGPAYVLTTLPFNIVAEQEVMAKDRVHFDSKQSQHYYVNDVQWTRRTDGLLTCTHAEAVKMTANRLSTDSLITEGYGNSYITHYGLALDALPDGSYYNAQQRRRAAQVNRIHEILNHPSDDILGIIFDRGSIHGCPYTSRDVRIMRKIFGACVACVKGKTVRATPGRVINQWVASAPGERLCMDVFFLSVVSRKGQVVSLPFLIVVDEYTEYVIVTWLTSRTADTVLKALTEVVKFYYSYDWCVKEICGDRDSIFLPLRASLLESKVELDIRATDQKIPRADRMIRTLRDIFRTIKAALWYKPPQFLYPNFMDDTAGVWNIRPNSRTIDRSPREIVEGKKLEFDQHIKTSLGSVGEFFVPPGKRQLTSKEDREVKKNEERTATGIVVRRNFDPTGTLEIYNLETGTRVNRCKVKLLRQPSNALRAQIRALTPTNNEVVEEDMILPVPRMTQSSKRATSSDEEQAPLDPSSPTLVNDNEDSRGENNNTDASDRVVEQSQRDQDELSTDAVTDLPVVRSTDDTVAAPSQDPTIEKEQSLLDIKHTDEEVTGVPDDVTTTSTNTNNESMQTPPMPNPFLCNDDTTSASIQEESNDNTTKDYPRRPGPRKLTRQAPAIPAAPQLPPQKVRAQRSNAGQQPERYANLAHNKVELENQFQEYVYTAADNLTITQAKNKHPTEHKKSLHSELTQFHDMSVGRPIRQMISGLKHDKIIGCKGFYKEVFDLRTGLLKKLKFRIVPHGHHLDRSLYEPQETTSPTVSMESVFACINIAAMENRRAFTMDIPGAYLNADLKDKHVVRFPRDLAAEYVELYPEYVKYLQGDGTLLMLIEKALYGLVESSALWYQEIKAFLLSLGYVVHPSDMGVFQKKLDNDTITICLWVDDFLGFSTNEDLIDELQKKVNGRFGDSRFDNGEVLNYIGMTISQPKRGAIIVKQTEYIKKIVKDSMVSKTSQSPNHPNLMKNKDSQTVKPLSDSKRFLSLVMSAMYAGKRSRPDILPPVCILASRVQSPDEDDMKYLLRVYEYLNNTTNLGLRFKPDKIELFYWIDASYNLHRDSRGHTGIVVTVGRCNAPIYVRSQKHKLHTRSSTEAELVATDEGVLHLLWMILVFDFLGFPQKPVTVFQDNQSTMRVCQTGHSKNGRLKHMVVRYNFIHGQQQENIISFEYIQSSDMVADIMSKPVDVSIFLKLRKLLLNIP